MKARALTAPIVVAADGFTISTPKHSWTLSFEEVSKVDVYKRDEFTTDLICARIFTISEGHYTVHENIPGFQDLMHAFEALPGFDRDSYSKVVLPPFAENRTMVFERRVTMD
jgi:hypothetical protein